MIKKYLFLFGFSLILLNLFSCKDVGRSRILHFTLLQTSDLHSHVDGYGAARDYTPETPGDNDGILGGYARIASIISAVKAEGKKNDSPVVVVDSGDFFMGTVYDLATTDPISLKFFQMAGYDAVTLGNHEFDWSLPGLALLLKGGIKNGFRVPILASNMITSNTSIEDDEIEELVNSGMITGKRVIELTNGLRIGILGIMGTKAASYATAAAPITFNHDYSFLQQQVNNLRNNEGVDMVILLSHSGIELDGYGEDKEIAENVNGIDIIASGHLHKATQTPFEYGNSDTLIFSPGEYGQWLSRLDVTYNVDTGSVESADFKLIPVDDSVTLRSVFAAVVSIYQDAINQALAPFSFNLDTPISKTSIDMEIPGNIGESALGNLVADSFRSVATNLSPLNGGNPVQIAIVPDGVIRDGFFSGKTGIITFTDVYNTFPLGISPDTSQTMPGYPLLSVYITGPDLKNVCETGLSLTDLLGRDFHLNFSGIRIGYKTKWGQYLQGVRTIELCPVDDTFSTGGTPIDLDDTETLYHVVVDLYTLSMLDAITTIPSIGFTIIPKDVYGNPISPQDYMLYRIDSDVKAGVQELKGWMALLMYLTSAFPPDSGGIPTAIYGEGGIGMKRIFYIE